MYIYQQKEWPKFSWDNDSLIPLLSEVRHLQGKMVGKMESLGFILKDEAILKTMTMDVIKTSEIEGEYLNLQQVRSSIARKLGMQISGLVPSDRKVDGIVDMMIDATKNYNKPLKLDRLLTWHSSLFPEGKSGMYNILTGKLRDDSTGPMQVVSGPLGREKVHYQAPGARFLKKEVDIFLKWFNQKETSELVIKAGVAHLWFVTLHPFEDGNGRIARAIADMLLARSDRISQRFYSMSAQIRIERKSYYDILEKTQSGSLDITGWLIWFLNCLKNGLVSSEKTLTKILTKHSFWNDNTGVIFNERQTLLLNRMLEGFSGNLTSSKWAKIARCSTDTALRDINDLISKDILKKNEAGGRSTSYLLSN